MNITKEQFLTSFFSNLNEEKIDYFVYGSYQNLPKDTGGSDIDIIICNGQINNVTTILLKLAKDNGVILASYYENANANANFIRLLSFLWGVQIDLFDGGLFYKGVPYYDIKRIKPFVIRHNGIKVVDIHKGFVVDYFKEIIHNGKAKEKYRRALMEDMTTNRLSCEKDILTQYGDDVLQLIQSNLDTDALNKIGKRLQKKLSSIILKGKWYTVLKTRFVLLSRFFKQRPGYVIVVEGTDGSGKSFIINSISPWLDECFHSSVVYNHLRPNVVPDLGVVLGKKKKIQKGEKPVVCSDPHAQKQSGIVGSLIRWGWYMIDYTFGYAKTVFKEIHTKSKFFIFDRYYYDYYIDSKRSRTNLPHWVFRFGECFVPSPDLILCLGGEPEKIYERKPETSLEEVTRQTEALKEFCAKRNNTVWIDTTANPEDSIAAAKKAILNITSKRFN